MLVPGAGSSLRSDDGVRLMCLAIPGEIVEVDQQRPEFATVDVQGVRRVVNTGLLDDVRTGQWVLIHVGFAMSRIDEEEARATIELLKEMGDVLDEEMAAMLDSNPE